MSTAASSDLFSSRQLLERCALSKWPALFITALIIAVFFRDQWIAAVVVFTLLWSFNILGDAYRYQSCWDKHRALSAKFTTRYAQVLSEQLNEHGLDLLIRTHWAPVEIAIERASPSFPLPERGEG